MYIYFLKEFMYFIAFHHPLNIGEYDYMLSLMQKRRKNKNETDTFLRETSMFLGSCPLSLRIDRTTEYWGFPHSSVGKESTCKAGDPSLIPG